MEKHTYKDTIREAADIEPKGGKERKDSGIFRGVEAIPTMGGILEEGAGYANLIQLELAQEWMTFPQD